MPPDQLPLRLGFLPFLRHARHVPAQQQQQHQRPGPIYVLGNPSADLDSIISAIIYSYFSSSCHVGHQQQSSTRLHVPVVNLPDVPAGKELRRLRPEFATALWLSTNSDSSGNNASPSAETLEELLAEHILTAADVRGQLLKQVHDQGQGSTSKSLFETVLVDWNALSLKSESSPGKGSIPGLEDIVDFSVIGCIDHHVDESFVPPAEVLSEGHPRIIQPGPGSCTSLVVRELRSRGLWLDKSSEDSGSVTSSSPAMQEEAKAAKLALAAILIDTVNLTAESKVTDVDRAAVAFLEAKVQAAAAARSRDQPRWDRTAFFEEIQRAKHNSLDLLTVDEILGRDYKDWVEKTSSSSSKTSSSSTTTTTKIGIASVVKPLSWIIEKAAQEEEEEDTSPSDSPSSSSSFKPFLDKLRAFSQSRELDVVAVMTAFPGGEEEEQDSFYRELLVWALNEEETCIERVKRFAEDAAKELELEEWSGSPGSGSGSSSPPGIDANTLAAEDGRKKDAFYMWNQRNLAKSRKQVAPLLRGVFACG